MLKHFTWQQFLIAALVLSIIWYAVIILVFYRQRIQNYLNGKYKNNKPPEPLGHAWDEEFEDEFSNDENILLVMPGLPDGMSKLSMSQFSFGPRGADEDLDVSRERQQSIVPDVLEELKSIFHTLEMQQGTKQDFISLFALVSGKYPTIKGTANERALNEYILKNAPFPISDNELSNLWN
ncbi:MAG: hypothetical protein JWR09_108 [Mucilaginibacter sp.]|nr:hypothetical protein [Mucilaginibacter sp.]